MSPLDHRKIGNRVPDVEFPVRENDEWRKITSNEIFDKKNVVIFALPGAFTPTCSSSHLPGYSAHANEIRATGIDSIYCLSVNDWFVMQAWKDNLSVGEEITMLPDGNMDFTKDMGMLLDKRHLGFGPRSWRYSMVVRDWSIDKLFVEDFADDGDPFAVSGAPNMLQNLIS
tara:strand:- start:87 stop:599 length:513 start_codon:yes stop_codon:yes gene_type:complete